MMKRHQSHGNHAEEPDEHEQPTEPMSKIIFAPSSATTVHDTGHDSVVIPTPLPHERPFPQQDARNAQNQHGNNRGLPTPSFPSSPQSQTPPLSPSYPYLPPAPRLTDEWPAGGVMPATPFPRRGAHRAKAHQPRRSMTPVLVGLFFVIVQLLLLVRFALKLIAMQPNSVWVNTIYGLTAPFVYPFHLLLQGILPSLPQNLEIYTLVAILLYGLLSRILVRFLKALLHSR